MKEIIQVSEASRLSSELFRLIIIGFLPTERGVVSTCSYEARKHGVHSAMNIKEAYRLCPHGIYMHGNYDKYKAVRRSG